MTRQKVLKNCPFCGEEMEKYYVTKSSDAMECHRKSKTPSLYHEYIHRFPVRDKDIKFEDYFFDNVFKIKLEITFYKDGRINSTIYDQNNFKNINASYDRRIILEKNERIAIPFEYDVEETIKNYRLL